MSPIQFVWSLAILSNLVFYCTELPLIRLAEDKICRQYFEHSPIQSPSQQDCRSPIIQDLVATFIGFKTAFDAIPPLLVSVWYGSRLSPKTIITLACTGELLNLTWVILVAYGDFIQDIRLAWLAALLLFIGGGQFLLYAMFGLIIVDVTQPQDRAKNLAVLHSITLTSSLVGSPLSGLLLKMSLSLALSLVIALALLRYPLIWALQNPSSITLNKHIERVAASTEETEVLLAASTTFHDPRAIRIWPQTVALLRVPVLAFSFSCFLLKRIAFTSEVLMYQAVAERLHQPLDDTAWIRIPIGLGATLALWVILPEGMRWVKQTVSHGVTAEAWAVKINLLLLVIGFASFWGSYNFLGLVIALTLCGIGEGLAPSLQTLATSVVENHKHGNLFAVISVIDTIAKLIGGPVMAWSFSLRDSHGGSYGYCFLLSSILFTLLLCWSFIVPVS